VLVDNAGIYPGPSTAAAEAMMRGTPAGASQRA
jgi:hypothetical protein